MDGGFNGRSWTSEVLHGSLSTVALLFDQLPREAVISAPQMARHIIETHIGGLATETKRVTVD